MSKVGEGIIRGLKQALAIVDGTAKEGTYVVHTPAEIEASDPAPKKCNTPSHPFRKKRGMYGAQRFKTSGPDQ